MGSFANPCQIAAAEFAILTTEGPLLTFYSSRRGDNFAAVGTYSATPRIYLAPKGNEELYFHLSTFELQSSKLKVRFWTAFIP